MAGAVQRGGPARNASGAAGPGQFAAIPTGRNLFCAGHITLADGRAAPRLAQTRPDRALLAAYWDQLTEALRVMAGLGLAHGDLSAFNLLATENRIVLIDLPQVVDVVGNPQGPQFLARDVHRIADWFAARGLPPEVGDASALLAELQLALGVRRRNPGGGPHR